MCRGGEDELPSRLWEGERVPCRERCRQTTRRPQLLTWIKKTDSAFRKGERRGYHTIPGGTGETLRREEDIKRDGEANSTHIPFWDEKAKLLDPGPEEIQIVEPGQRKGEKTKASSSP